MNSAEAPEQRPLERARFLERFAAFAIDYALVLLLARTAAACLDVTALRRLPQLFALAGAALWLGGFLLYHAAMNAGGRRSIGKRLLGLQVYTQDGYPLGFAASLKRAAAYLLSGPLAGLGFLSAAWNPRRLALHDRIAGTMVLESQPGDHGLGLAAGLGAALVLVTWFGASRVLLPLGEPHQRALQLRLAAEESLRAVAALEEIQHARAGRYTENLATLGAVYGDDGGFVRILKGTLVKLRIQATPDHYRLQALPRDSEGTLLELSGPPRRNSATR